MGLPLLRGGLQGAGLRLRLEGVVVRVRAGLVGGQRQPWVLLVGVGVWLGQGGVALPGSIAIGCLGGWPRASTRSKLLAWGGAGRCSHGAGS